MMTPEEMIRHADILNAYMWHGYTSSPPKNILSDLSANDRMIAVNIAVESGESALRILAEQKLDHKETKNK